MRDYPAAVAYPAFPDEVAEVLRAAAAAGLPVAAQGTGHGAPPLEGRLTDAVLLRTSAMTELDVDAERRTARAGAGVLWGDLADAAGPARAGRPAPLVAGRRRGRLLARRRHRLVRPATGPAVQRGHRRRARARRRHVRPRDRRPRRRSCSGRCAAGAAPLGVVTALEFELFPLDTVVAGLPGLGLDRGRARAARAGWPGARTPRRRRRRRSGCSTSRPTTRSPPSCAAAGSRSSTAPCWATTPFAAEVLAPLRALRPGVRHGRPGAGGLARPAAPRPGGADPGLRQQHPGLRPARRGHRRDHRRPSGPGRAPGWRRPSCASSAARWPGPTPTAARCPPSTARSSRSVSAWRRGRDHWARQREDAARFLAAVGAVGDRPPVPADARRPHRHPEGLPAGRARAAVRRPARRRPAAPLPRAAPRRPT